MARLCQITYVQHTHTKTAKAAAGPAKRERTFNIKFSTSNNMFCKATTLSHAHFMRQFGVLVKLTAMQYSSLLSHLSLSFSLLCYATKYLGNHKDNVGSDTPSVLFILHCLFDQVADEELCSRQPGAVA